MSFIRSFLMIQMIFWSVDASAVLWRLGAVSTDTLKIFTTTGDTQKTIAVNVAGVGVFSKVESVWTDTTDGSPENTYYAVLEVTGLTAWTDYSYRILEDGVDKGGGQFRTLPDDKNTPFELAMTSCNISRTDGLKNEIVNRSYANGGNIIAILHVDDIAYIDASTLRDSIEGVQTTGVPRETKLSYDYAASWIVNVFNDSSDGQQWLNHNMPTFWMWGDHEVANDFLNHNLAIEEFSSGTRESGEHTTHDNKTWLAANKAYSRVAEASPTTFDDLASIDGLNGKTYAYGFDIGPVRFFLHDRNSAGECYNCTPDVECIGKICGEILSHQNYRENFGKTQLDHLKTWLDDDTHPFKVLFSGITVGGHSIVDNQPWLSWWPAEYYDFEAWLDSNANVNGSDGNFIYVAGDRHNFSVHKRSKEPPYNGGANFMEYYVGTVNGTSNHPASPIGEIKNGCEVLYSETGGSGVFDHWLTVMSVNQSTLSFETIDKNYDVIFEGTLEHGKGNHFSKVKPGLNVMDAILATPDVLTKTGIKGGNVDFYSDVAYLSTGWKGINIVDINDPLLPKLIGSVGNRYSNNVTVKDNYLYISSGWEGLEIYDISNPLIPDKIGIGLSIAGSYIHDVAIDEFNHAFVASKGGVGLQIFDISNALDPVILGWVDIGEVNAIEVTSDYLLIANGSQGLSILFSAEATISVTPTTFDFGVITISSISEVMTFEISNVGTTDLIISDISYLGDDSDFFIESTTCSSIPLTIGAGLSCDFGLAFSSFTPSEKSMIMRFISNDAVTPVFDITVSGTGEGVPPQPDIKVNGQDESLNLLSGSPVSIDISLTSGSLQGIDADIFVGVQTVNGIFWLKADGGWEVSSLPFEAVVTGSLSDMPLTNLMDQVILPWSGRYLFFIIVDTIANNVLDGISYADTVEVNIN